MTTKALSRYTILQKVQAKELTQEEASRFLQISDRQIRNLLTSLRNYGPKGLVSKQREKEGNTRKPPNVKTSALALLRGEYEGFGPTLATYLGLPNFQ